MSKVVSAYSVTYSEDNTKAKRARIRTYDFTEDLGYKMEVD